MRRSPFYAYPHSFYAPPAEASYHRPRRSSPATPPTPTPRSVINIPVFDSPPSWPSSSPPQPHPIDPRPPSSAPPALASPAVPLIDPSSAATTIQSLFRGFCVRKHHPLLHLRSIVESRKQLEELRSEFESPGFPLKMRASEKERLRFGESIMAIILRLDAIEGSMPDVRSQRKEATKIAIKLQDALDAIMMQKDEIADLNPTDGHFSEDGVVPDDDVALSEQSEESLCPDVNMVKGVGHTISEEGIMDVNAMQEEYTSPEGAVTDNCMPNLDKDYIMDIVSPLRPLQGEDLAEQREAGELLMSKLGCSESVPQDTDAEAMYEAEQYMCRVITGAAEEEGKNVISALHLEAHKNHMLNDALVAKVDHDSSVDEKIVASHGCANVESSGGSYKCMDVVQKVKEDRSQDVELCPGTPTAEEKCDHPQYSSAAHQNQLPSTALERLTEGYCSSDSKGSPTLHRYGYERRSDEARENSSDEPNSCNEVKAHSSSLSLAGTASLPDSALLHQLSEDCRQLKSLAGNLLVQNKAQSKVLCALGERLELLELQHQLECWRNQQNRRAKRKLKKGAKRSVKCHDFN